MKKIWIPIIVVVIIIIAVVIFYKPTPKETIKIGAILSLTGDLQKYGEGVKNAINLAIEQLDLENEVKLFLEDDYSCQEKDAVTAAQKLINIDKVNFIIGPLCSASTIAVCPIAETSKTLMISPSASSPAISDCGEYIFRTWHSDKLKSVKTAEFIVERLGLNKIALLIDISNDSFARQREDLKETLNELGAEIVSDEVFKTKDVDFRTQLVKIKKSQPQVIVFAGFAKEVGAILKQAVELDVNTVFVSSDVMVEDPDVIEIARNSAEGVIYAYPVEPANPEYEDFIRIYEEEFSEMPPPFAAEAYDATLLAIKAFQESGKMDEILIETFYNLGQNYMGASGEITFDKNGDVIKPLMFKTIKNGQFVPYEE